MITSFRHDNERKLKRRKILGAVFFFAVLIFLVRGPLTNSLSGVLVEIGRPFWSVEEGARGTLADVVALFSSKLALQKENAQLKETIDSIAVEALSRDRLRDENTELKAELGRDPESTLILGRVLASPAVSPYDTLIIDAGTDHGVTIGMDAYTDGDFVIGRVTRTWKRSALVTLVSSPDNEFSVVVGSSSIPTLAHGMGGGNIRIVLPRGSSASIGDLADIPQLANSYVGVVATIDQPEGSSLETLFLRLPFNINQIRWVYLAVPQEDNNAFEQKNRTKAL